MAQMLCIDIQTNGMLHPQCVYMEGTKLYTHAEILLCLYDNYDIGEVYQFIINS